MLLTACSLALSLAADGRDLDCWITTVNGRESVGELWEYVLELSVSSSHRQTIDELLGQKVSLSVRLRGQPERSTDGIVIELERQRATDQGDDGSEDLVRYRVTLAPRIAVLGMGSRSRVYHHVTLSQLIEDTMKGYMYSIDFQEDLALYQYAVQYYESDWNHLQRRLEDDGIYYWFDSQHGDERVRFADTSSGAPVVATLPLGCRTDRQGCYVERWRESQEAVPWKSSVHDHHFERLHPVVSAKGKGSEFTTFGSRGAHVDLATLSHVEIQREEHLAQRFSLVSDNGVFDASGLDRLQPELARRAQVRAEQVVSHGFRARGTSNSLALRPGVAFDLVEADESTGRYFVTKVSTSMRIQGPSGEPVKIDPFRCEFECIPIGVPYRPSARTARPSIPGVETATVLGVRRGDVTTNREANVKVRFPWGKKEEQLSCWVRVLQKNAGAGYGAKFLPRAGQEVVVGFESADPDRPVILGSLSNERHPTAGDRSTHQHRHGLSIRSEHGSATNVSGLVFDNLKNREKLHLHAEQDLSWTANEDQLAQSGGNFTIDVGDPIGAEQDNLFFENSAGPDKPSSGRGDMILTVANNLIASISGNADGQLDGVYSSLVHGNTLWVAKKGADIAVSTHSIAGSTWTEATGFLMNLTTSRIQSTIAPFDLDWIMAPIHFKRVQGPLAIRRRVNYMRRVRGYCQQHMVYVEVCGEKLHFTGWNIRSRTASRASRKSKAVSLIYTLESGSEFDA